MESAIKYAITITCRYSTLLSTSTITRSASHIHCADPLSHESSRTSHTNTVPRTSRNAKSPRARTTRCRHETAVTGLRLAGCAELWYLQWTRFDRACAARVCASRCTLPHTTTHYSLSGCSHRTYIIAPSRVSHTAGHLSSRVASSGPLLGTLHVWHGWGVGGQAAINAETVAYARARMPSLLCHLCRNYIAPGCQAVGEV